MIWTFLLSCTDPSLEITAYTSSEQQLRLLSRREYRNSIAYLQKAILEEESSSISCTTTSDCQYQQTCMGRYCVQDPCSMHTFSITDNAAQLWLHIEAEDHSTTTALSGNLGALPMQSTNGVHSLKLQLPNQDYQYYFTRESTDGDILLDPTNPLSAENSLPPTQRSLWSQQCSTLGYIEFDDTESFPVESSTQGYLFDNQSVQALVSTTHLDGYLDAAISIADRIELPECDDCLSAFIDSAGAVLYRRTLNEEEKNQIQEASSHPDIVQNDPRRSVLSILLSSPHFLYRSEIGSRISSSNTSFAQLNQDETATALAYFIWGAPPDTLLLLAAQNDELQDSEQIRAQAQRLFATPRARAHWVEVIAQWLGLQQLRALNKNRLHFPAFNEQVAYAMEEELRHSLYEILFREEATFSDLLLWDKGYINKHSSPLYNQNIESEYLQPFPLPEGRKAGVLAQLGWLSTFAHSDQSSPIKRGVAIRERLLCHDLPDPPADAGMAPEIDFSSSAQQRFTQHTLDPNCASCHQYIDGLGLPLETYDGIGSYREEENGHWIDPRGEIIDLEDYGAGTSVEFSSLQELAEILAASQRASYCFVQQIHRFSIGGVGDSNFEATTLRLHQNFGLFRYHLDRACFPIGAGATDRKFKVLCMWRLAF